MFIYIAFYIFIVFYSFIGYNPNKTINKNVYWFIVVLIILFAACRGNGYDWDNYYDIYRCYHNGGERVGAQFVEYGFQFLCHICPNYRSLIVLVAFLSIGLLLSASYRLSSQYTPLLGLVVFCTTYLLGGHMGQIRQALACGIVMWAIVYAVNNKKIYSIILIIIAAFFHVSALIALIVPFISHKQQPYIFYIIAIVVAFAISYSVIAPITDMFVTVDSTGISDKIMVYSMSTTSARGFTSTILIRIILLLIALVLNRNENPDMSFICNTYFYGILIYGAFNFLPEISGRGGLYFVVLDLVIIPYILYRIQKNQLLYLMGYIIIVSLSAYRLLGFFADPLNYNSFVPYLG